MFRKENAFKRPTDIFHALAGFIAGIIIIFNGLCCFVSFLFLLIYVIYQSLDAEDVFESFFDLVEFLVGFAAALPIVFWWFIWR